MEILIHSCCGPCLTAVVEHLLEGGTGVIPLWYNPNIMPYREYRNRLQAFRDVCGYFELEPIVIDEYDLNEILHNVLVPTDARCGYCYGYRLDRVAKEATERGIGAFTTTLLQSPYQQHEAVADAGSRAGEAYRVDFIYEDMRGLYRRGKEITGELDVYRQGYCGCIYSEEERYRK
ncbi:MAG: epoxyqueuosine reductase QueH [bacterium]|nr:epoxyqueuosine reductase QueH [bacterium]